MRALAVLLGETPRREAASGLVGVGRACGLLGGRSLVHACVHSALSVAAACMIVSSSPVRRPLAESCHVPWYQ